MQPAAALAGEHQPGFLDDFYRRTIGFQLAHDTPEGVTLRSHCAQPRGADEAEVPLEDASIRGRKPV